MEVSDFLELVEWDWCQLPRGGMLHAMRSFDGDDDWVPVGGPGVTACGIRGRLGIPGLFSRLGATRCYRCCSALGYPFGAGSPKNDDACRLLVEARIAAQTQKLRMERGA